MFAFLSKKITIPNESKIKDLSWGTDQGYISVGGEKGLLKVLKLEDSQQNVQASQVPGQPAKPVGALSINHTLEGHSGTVNIVRWNDQYKKLTTSDENGLIVVWMLHKNFWFEEMINNRNKSIVVDMKWSPDGTKICIIYQDGAVIVGSVEGTRLWGKELKHQLQIIDWSPDSKLMLFGTPEGQLMVYDNEGNFLHQIKIFCLQKLNENDNNLNPNMKLQTIQWYEGSKMYTDDTPCGLLIVYECGRIQLMKNDKDEDPVLIDTTLTIYNTKWNNNGTIFATAGTQLEGEEQTKRGVVQFYNNQGIHLKTVKIQASDHIAAISWESTGLRLAMAYEYSIYFANVKADYKWGFLNQTSTLIFAYQKSDRIDFSIIFWNVKSDTKQLKFVKNLNWIRAVGEYCLLITKQEESENFQLTLCNSVGSSVDQKFINFEPTCIAMSYTHIVVCSYDHVYCWQYKNQTARLTTFSETYQTEQPQNYKAGLSQKRAGRENAWFIDDQPDSNVLYDIEKYDPESQQTDDPICAVSVIDGFFFVARMNGSIHKYTLPLITLENKQFVKCRPQQLYSNCDGTRLAVIDMNGFLSLFEVNNQGGSILPLEKKDDLGMMVRGDERSEDLPHSFACMEKSRMYTFKDLDPEEPIQTEAFLCSYNELTVKCVYLDEIMKSPDGNLKVDEIVVDFETKSLRDTRDIIHKVSLVEAFSYVEQNPHPKLWKILIEKSLEDVDFVQAEKGLLKINDFQGLQFIKRIKMIDDKSKQQAEILAYFGKYDDAEMLYKKIDRKDLAIQLRMRIGDWNRVIQMIKEGTGYDEILQQAYLELGNFHADRFQWDLAAQNYLQSKNQEKIVEALFKIEEYDVLEEMIPNIGEGQKELLNNLGDRFQNVGLCDSAVKCYIKARDVKKAIDCCVLLNQWNLAVELAEQYKFMQIEGLITQYSTLLLEQRRKLEAAELFRKANRNTESARIFQEIANDLIEREANPLMIKKLYVMAALEIEQHKKRIFDATMTGGKQSTQKTLDSLITSDINTSTDKILNNPWRGAEAWHFYLLAQQQLYNKQYNEGLKTAIRLAEYELELGTNKIYSIIALASYYNLNFLECSRAFVKLEGMANLSDELKEQYEDLAAVIFTKHPPSEPNQQKIQCIGKQCSEQVSDYQTHCFTCGVNFQPCVASGRSIVAKEYYTCKFCRHKMIESEVLKRNLKFCALCHQPIVDFGIQKVAKQGQGIQQSQKM